MRTRTGKKVEDKEPPKREPKKDPSKTIRVPHDAINEMVVIAAVIVDESARKRYLASIPADSFYGAGHSAIWSGLQELQRRQLSYDPATLKGLVPDVDTRYVENLVKSRPEAPPNLRHHVELIQWDRARIELVNGPLVDLIEAVQDQKCPPEHLRSLTSRLNSVLGNYGTQQYLRNSSELIREQSAKLTARREGIAVYPYGIPGIDNYESGHEMAGRPRLLPGTAPGMVTVVTGLSGSGKSTTTLNAISGMFDANRRVLVGAWEQGEGMTLEILAAIRLGFNRRDLIEGAYTAEDQKRLEEEMERVCERVRFFRLPFGEARGKSGFNDRNMDLIQQVVADSGCDVFVADLFRRALKETSPDDEEQALYRMQAMAQELNAHFILVQQQKSKEVEARRDPRPTRDNIKGSSAWVDIADQILAWHRPAQWKDVPDNTIEGLVLKQRYGPWPIAVEIDYEPEYGFLGEGRSVSFTRSADGDEDYDALGDFLTEGRSKRRGKRS